MARRRARLAWTLRPAHSFHRDTSPEEWCQRSQERPRHDCARRARRHHGGLPEAPSSVYVRTRDTNRAADGSERWSGKGSPVFMRQGKSEAHGCYLRSRRRMMSQVFLARQVEQVEQIYHTQGQVLWM